MAELPLNIIEFNNLAGLVLVKLYEAFPQEIDLNFIEFARKMGITEDPNSYKFPSGVTFPVLWGSTVKWLTDEGFIRPAVPGVAQRIVLAMRGLNALNAVPPGLKQTLGTAVGDLSAFGDLMGGLLGGFTKSITGG